MKALAVIGTFAMFMVGGGILTHGSPPVHHTIADLAELAGWLRPVVSLSLDILVGVVGGVLVLAVVMVISKIRGSVNKGKNE